MSAKDQTETDGRGRFARKRAAADAPRQRSLGSLRMVWQAGTRYPGHVALALLALFITAAATLAIPAGFKMVINNRPDGEDENQPSSAEMAAAAQV